MRAVVLVGGEGTRLRPLTLTRPKPMLPVGGIPMLARKLAHLAEHRVTEAVLSLGYRPDAFIAAFPSGEAAGVRLQYAVEPSPLDTAGAIRFAAAEAGFLDGSADPIIAANGDVLTTLDLTAQVAFHRSVGARATIALTRVEDPSAFGVVPCDPDGRVIAFVEKPKREDAPTNWINAGTYVLDPSVIRAIPAETRISIERIVFPDLVAEGTLYAVHADDPWIDAGIPSTYLQANLDAIGGSNSSAAGIVHPSARVSAGAIVECSVLGARCVIGQGAVVRRSVLLDGAVVETGAIVEDSILGEGARVGEGAVLRGLSVVGDGALVLAGAELIGARVPN